MWNKEAKKLLAQSTRWHERISAETGTSEQTFGTKRLSNLLPRSRRAGTKDIDPVDFTRRIEALCGGVCVATEEVNHCFVIVIGTKAERFVFDREGGFFRSPLLHPFLSVRVPKRACSVIAPSIFKASQFFTWMLQFYVKLLRCDSILSPFCHCDDECT